MANNPTAITLRSLWFVYLLGLVTGALSVFILTHPAHAHAQPVPSITTTLPRPPDAIDIARRPSAPVLVCPDATYRDAKGASWICKACRCEAFYPELVAHGNDPGLCGLPPFETGEWDPLYQVCRRHDAMYDFQKDHDGRVEESILRTNGTFALVAAENAARGVFSIAEFAVYVPLVFLIGVPIQLWRWAKRKRENDAQTEE